MLRQGDVTGWAHGLPCDDRRQRVTKAREIEMV